MRRAKTIRYASLTSLLDVLFIVVFASLVHAAAAGEAAPDGASAGGPGPDAGAGADAAPVADALSAADAGAPPDAGRATPSRSQLYRQALRELWDALPERSAIHVRVSSTGELVSIEREDRGELERLELDVPLLERVPDPDVGVAYLGDRIAELRACTVVRRHLGHADLGGSLVILVPEVPLADLPVALVRGLRRDQERCLADESGVAVVVDPLRAARRSSSP